jgi:hypothetical protein
LVKEVTVNLGMTWVTTASVLEELCDFDNRDVWEFSLRASRDRSALTRVSKCYEWFRFTRNVCLHTPQTHVVVTTASALASSKRYHCATQATDRASQAGHSVGWFTRGRA